MFSHLFDPPFLIAMLLALSVHEWAHALAADRLGDSTARHEGRLTLNPAAHLDLMGTLFFLIVGFGWGKPVPVNPRHFSNIRRGSALVAAAGPLSNMLLALAASVALRFLPPMLEADGRSILSFSRELASTLIIINLSLMAFNLLPIAPLDGSKVFQAFIPARYEHAVDQWMERGPMILLGLVFLEYVLHVPILMTWVQGIVFLLLPLFH